ncbi:hypothetical protein CHS0354_003645 [Potamilus streckersoni]|uniref:Chitin-binding type-2 domain-containing protein n=1 Tax=Potamilus streckersoni TaxID=2493646 RepID=A0AAE0S922_9BIVA|nr:hypothetical protein CHS0354_003645 [Potamilus streckersoni]
MYPDGQTCYGYYICMKGRSKSGMCPTTFAFNSLKGGCVPDTNCLQPSSLRHPCFPGTAVPVPEEPTMFYLWNGAKIFTPMTCPKGLWYNPVICSCDWIIPGKNFYSVCQPMFSFSFEKSFLEDYNRVPQDPNTHVAIYQKSARFTKGGRIAIWMMNDLDLDSEWAMCFEFMTHIYNGEVALVSDDWKDKGFTYKITYIPEKALVKGYFRMKDDSIADLTIVGVDPNLPHFLRVAKIGPKLKMRVDNTAPAAVLTKSGVSPTKSPMVIGAANDCEGFEGFFDELKFFRCIPDDFFDDYKSKIYNF